MVRGDRYIQMVLHPPIDVPVTQCVSMSAIFTFHLKSLHFRGKTFFVFEKKKPLSVTQIYFPAYTSLTWNTIFPL